MRILPDDFVSGGGGSGTSFLPPRLGAVAFFDPRLSASKEIVELLDLVDVFSGEHIDIYIRGYTSEPPADVNKALITEISVGPATHYFSAAKLKKDVDELERSTLWRFSMEVDVILFNQIRWSDSIQSGAWPDYSNAIVLNAYRMLKDGKITSYVSFFGELVRFARDYQGDNPAWDFSDAKAWKELKSSLFESFKRFLFFRKFRMNVEDYAVQNITKTNP